MRIWIRSWTELETWYVGNSSQVREAVWGLPLVTDPNRQGVLLCDGSCEETDKSACWWTSCQAFFFTLSPVALSLLLSFLSTPFIFSQIALILHLIDALILSMLACSTATALLWNPPALLTLHISSLFLHLAGWKNCVWHYFSVPVENSGSIDLLAYTMFKCGSPLIREQSS